MSKRILLHSLLFLPILIACSYPLAEAPVATPVEEENNAGEELESDWEYTLLALVNDLRKKGCQCGNEYMPPVDPLTLNAQLNQAAQVHARDMHSNRFFKHKGTDGSRVGDRAKKAGYQWNAVGENLSAGYPTVVSSFEGWKDSPPHCENMMSPLYREMGAGKSGTYWVQTFGKQKN